MTVLRFGIFHRPSFGKENIYLRVFSHRTGKTFLQPINSRKSFQKTICHYSRSATLQTTRGEQKTITKLLRSSDHHHHRRPSSLKSAKQIPCCPHAAHRIVHRPDGLGARPLNHNQSIRRVRRAGEPHYIAQRSILEHVFLRFQLFRRCATTNERGR